MGQAQSAGNVSRSDLESRDLSDRSAAWLTTEPTSRGKDGLLRFYVCTGEVQVSSLALCDFELTQAGSLAAARLQSPADSGEALARTTSAPQPRRTLERQSSVDRSMRPEFSFDLKRQSTLPAWAATTSQQPEEFSFALNRQATQWTASPGVGTASTLRAYDTESLSESAERTLKLQNIAPGCWFGTMAVPGKDSPWRAHPQGAAMPKISSGTLHFRVVAQGGDDILETKRFSVPIFLESASSRVLFALLSPSGSAQSRPDLGALYQSALSAMSLRAAQAALTVDEKVIQEDPELHLVESVYEAAWEHGLLVQFLKKTTASSRWPFNLDLALQGLATHIDQHHTMEWTSAQIIEVWSMVGQVLSMLQEEDSKESVAVPDSILRMDMLSPDEFAQAQLQTLARRRHALQSLGAEHLYRFVKSGLKTTFEWEKKGTVSSFRHVRELPLQCDLELLADNTSTAAAMIELSRTERGYLNELRQNCQTSALQLDGKMPMRGAMGALAAALGMGGGGGDMDLGAFGMGGLGGLGALLGGGGGGGRERRRAGGLGGLDDGPAQPPPLPDVIRHIIQLKNETVPKIREELDKVENECGDLAKAVTLRGVGTSQVQANVQDCMGAVAGARAAMEEMALRDHRTLQERIVEYETLERRNAARGPRFGQTGTYEVGSEAGNGTQGRSDAAPRQAQFNHPAAALELPDGRILILDKSNNALRMQTREGGVTTLIGAGGQGRADGPVARARLNRPKGMCLCKDGSVLIADTGNNRIVRVTPDLSQVLPVAGGRSTKGGHQDDVGPNALFNRPADVAERVDGAIIVADEQNHCLRVITQEKGTYQVRTLVGNPKEKTVRDGAPVEARLHQPNSVYCAPNGVVFFTEGHPANCVRQLAPTGVVTLAGQPGTSGNTDGSSKHALFHNPCGVVPDDKSILVCDSDNHVVRKISPEGNVTTVAGSRNAGYRDGATHTARMQGPRMPYRRRDGVVLFCDSEGHRVRKLATPTTQNMARRAMTEQDDEQRDALDTLRDLGKGFLKSIDDTRRATERAWETLHFARVRAHCVAFALESKKTLSFCEQRAMLPRREHFRGLIAAAPRLMDLSDLLLPLYALLERDEELLQMCSSAIRGRVQRYSWRDRIGQEVRDDLQALTILAQSSNGSLVDQQTVCSVFERGDFTAPLDESTLALIDAVFRPPELPEGVVATKGKDHERGLEDMRHSVGAWLSNMIPIVAKWRQQQAERMELLSRMGGAGGPATRRRKGGGKTMGGGSLMDFGIPEALLGLEPQIEFAAVVEEVLTWWNTALGHLQSTGQLEPFVDVLRWLINTHLSEVCVQSAQPTIESIPQIARFALSPLLGNAYVSAVCRASCSLRPDVAFNLLDAVIPKSRPVETMRIVYSAMGAVIDKLREGTFGSDCVELSLDMILEEKNFPLVWADYLVWGAQEEQLAPKGVKETEVFAKLRQLIALTENAFAGAANDIDKGLCRVRTVYKCVEEELLERLTRAWKTCQCSGTTKQLHALVKELDGAVGVRQRLQDVAAEFLHLTTIEKSLNIFQSNWDDLRVCDVRTFLCMAPPSEPAKDRVWLEPLPQQLIDALEWLFTLRQSKLFKQIWNEQASEDGINRLIPASRAWLALSTTLQAQTITFERLEQTAKLLVDPTELTSLSLTAEGFQDKGNKCTWKAPARGAAVPSWFASTLTALQKWRHLDAVKRHLDNMLRSLLDMKQFLLPASKSQATISEVQKHLRQLGQLFSKRAWPAETLKEYSRYSKHAEAVDPRLVNVDDDIVHQMTQSTELLDWLRENPNDADFASGLQIARGKSEMECPPELWIGPPRHVEAKGTAVLKSAEAEQLQGAVDAQDAFIKALAAGLKLGDDAVTVSKEEKKNDGLSIAFRVEGPDSEEFRTLVRTIPDLLPQLGLGKLRGGDLQTGTVYGRGKGHLDEAKLAQLTNVRTGLHPVIFRDDELFADLNAALAAFDQTDVKGADSRARLIESMQVCSLYLMSLKKLLTDEGPDDVIHRLISIRDATWTCCNDVGGTDHTRFLKLNFFEPTTTELRPNEYDVHKALDFQSTLVLSQGTNRTPQIQACIDEYIDQLNWMQRLNDNLYELSQSGHFKYQEYKLTFPALQVGGVELIKDKERETRAQADKWERDVTSVREQYYFMNYFSMKQLWKLVIFLSQEQSQADLPLLRELVQTVFPDLRTDAAALKLASLLREKGTTFKIPDDEVEALQRCGKLLNPALQALVADVQTSAYPRPISVPAVHEHAPGFDVLAKGIHVVSCDRRSLVYDQILSAFARSGFLPEREFVCVIRPDSSWDDVRNLLLRWRDCPQRFPDAAPALYCLAFVEELPFDVQHKAVRFIRDSSQGAASVAPLLILSGTQDSVHLVAQFSHCRRTVFPAPDTVLREIGAELSNKYSSGVTAFSSVYAGAGKSFEIRRSCVERKSMYVHVPIMSGRGVVDRIRSNTKHVRQQGATGDHTTLHVDLAHTVPGSFDSVLFELTYLRGIVNTYLDQHLFWDPSRTTLAVEVASGPELLRLHVWTLLPQKVIAATQETFCATPEGLAAGMGPEFDSPRSDGAALGGTTFSNAYQRLQYVCRALDIYDNKAGKFPKEYHGVGDEVLDGRRCFYLLLHNTGLKKRPSLWCIWNFVNLLYWELRELHHDSSIVNMVFEPDPNGPQGEYDIVNKESQKGSILQFMIQTAIEFATRQTRKEDPLGITGLDVKGFTHQMFNGEYVRMEFLFDGKPCFKRRQKYKNIELYIYYRAHAQQWVLNDALEPQGPVYCTTTPGESRLHEGWTTTVQFKETKAIKVDKIKDTHGFMEEAMRISGCGTAAKEMGHQGGISAGSSISEKEDGVYLRQGPDDAVEAKSGHPHYMKYEETVDPHGRKEIVRRHLFYYDPKAEKNGPRGGNPYWAICPVCDLNQGQFAQTASKELERWKIKPPDKPEARVVITLKNGGDQVEGKLEDMLAIIAEDAGGADDNLESLLKWNDSNHECMLFSNKNNVVRFLSLDPEKMRAAMRPELKTLLENAKINIGESLDQLSETHYEVLSSLTEIVRTKEEGHELLGGHYCLTGDNLLKMLAIFVRVRCGVPVVLMGECGCGKTELIRYMCAWLNADLRILDVHGGTTEEDIVGIFKDAEAVCKQGKSCYVFLDEINTCAHMGLISEAICLRSLYGRRLPDNVYILAALNPYRLRPEGKRQTVGMAFTLHEGQTPDEMSALVYRVHPVPLRLKDFIFDFGALSEKPQKGAEATLVNKEEFYINSMVEKQLSEPFGTKRGRGPQPVYADETQRGHIAKLIVHAQRYIRDCEGDESAASLRDVKRCLNLTKWFMQDSFWHESPAGEGLAPITVSATLGIAFVYFFRLSTKNERQELWKGLRGVMRSRATAEDDASTAKDGADGKGGKGSSKKKTKQPKQLGMEALAKDQAFEDVIADVQKRVADNMEVEDGIAKNQALSENLFVSVVCILNRIPVFIVGKPGSSKTLSMQVIASNLQGQQSPVAAWRKHPSIHVVSYQCSPMSDADSIEHQFETACRSQKDADNTIVVLLLDEVGLAEHSPDMPLKVLHGMLVDPPVAIVGLSNWVLDPAKMNRAICLQRPEPERSEIEQTGHRIVQPHSTGDAGQLDAMWRKLPNLAHAYHEVYLSQKELGREFIGLRDYYGLIKLLRRLLSGKLSDKVTPDLAERLKRNKNQFSAEILQYAVCRNFSGKPDLLDHILERFQKQSFPALASRDKVAKPDVRALIEDNLMDDQARHVMILTRSGAALPLLFSCKLNNFSEKDTPVLIGSRFRDDLSELHLVKQINEVKKAMASGRTVVLLNHDNIYEALYDVLNQRYVYKQDKKGVTKKKLRLAIGPRSQLCDVKDGFKMVVIVEQTHAYENLDLPLLNRFEKQVLTPDDLLGPNQVRAVAHMREWVDKVLTEAQLDGYMDIFSGYHKGTVPSLVLNLSNFDDSACPSDFGDPFFDTLKNHLAAVALPIAAHKSDALLSLSDVDYFTNHGDLASILSTRVLTVAAPGAMLAVVTHSPVSHLETALTEQEERVCRKWNIVHLAEMPSERQLTETLSEFIQSADQAETGDMSPALLVVQCDPIACSQPLIDHARRIAVQQRELFSAERGGSDGLAPRHLVFLIHLPPGAHNQERNFVLDFYRPWDYVFIDDLRPVDLYDAGEAGMVRLDTRTLLQYSAYELATQFGYSVRRVIQSRFQSALSACMLPPLANADKEQLAHHSHSNRIATVQRMIQQQPKFLQLLEDLVLRVLATKQDLTELQLPHHLHVQMANELRAGSLRQSLMLSLELLTIQALSHVLRCLDVNFNLALLEPFEELWYALSEQQSVLNKDAVARRPAQLGALSMLTIRDSVENTGRHGAVAAKFPFSWQIISSLNHPNTRESAETAEARDNADPYVWLAKQCEPLFGPAVIAAWSFEDRVADYLHDFVATVVPEYPGLPFDMHLDVCDSVMRLTRPDILSSPAGIHVAWWKNELRLFNIASLLSLDSIPMGLRQQIVQSVRELLGQAPGQRTSQDPAACVDVAVLYALFVGLWALAESQDDSWYAAVIEATPDVEALLALIEQHLSQGRLQANTADYIRRMWSGLRLCQIFVREIGVNATQFAAIVHDQIEDRDPSSHQVFVQAVGSVAQMLTAATAMVDAGCHFVQRYVCEIVFGKYSPSVEPELAKVLVALINGEQNAVERMPAASNNLPLRRATLRCMVTAPPATRDALLVNGIRTAEAAQLLVQYYADLHVAHQEQITKDDVALLSPGVQKEDLGKPTNDKQCQTLARSLLQVTAYAHKLSRVGKAKAKELQAALQVGALRDILMGNHEAMTHVLKWLFLLGGTDRLRDVLVQNEAITPWIKADRLALGSLSMINLVDPFPWLSGKDQYEAACTVCRSVLIGKAGKEDVEKTAQKHGFKSPTLLAAVFGQTFNNESIDPTGMENLRAALNMWAETQAPSDKDRAGDHRDLVTWFANGSKFLGRPSQDERSAAAQLQFAVHCALRAMSADSDSFLYALLFDPKSQARSYIPSLPDSELHSLFHSMRAAVNAGKAYDIGFYYCPNQHMYTIWNCGRPWVEYMCPVPGCGRIIGGKGHVEAPGNRMLGSVRNMGRELESELEKRLKKGYHDTDGDNADEVGRITPVTVRVLRLIIHSLLRVSLALGNESRQKDIASLVLPAAKDPTVERAAEALAARSDEDWRLLLGLTNLGDSNLVLALHIMLDKLKDLKKMPAVFDAYKLRDEFELKFQKQCVEPIVLDLREQVRKAEEDLSATEQLDKVRRAFGDDLWVQIREEHFGAGPSVDQKLWRLREAVTFQHFKSTFELRGENKSDFPLLAAFLQGEATLPLIKYAGYMLAWHGIIYSVHKPYTLERDSCPEITNRMVIEQLPKARQKEAFEIFEKFAEGFRKVLPLLEKIEGCVDNPFRKDNPNRQGEEDDQFVLNMEINLDTSVQFSIPWLGPDPLHPDVQLCCTRAIARKLDESHSGVLGVLKTEQGKTKTEGPTAVVREEAALIPWISYQTPLEMMKKQLLFYDRESDLMPLLREYSVQTLKYGEGDKLTYQFNRIEQALIDGLLSRAARVRFSDLPDYRFKGDFKKFDKLDGLKKHVTQENLPRDVRDAILSEVTTNDHMTRLVLQIEECVVFLGSVGGTGASIDGDLNLERYVLETLSVPPEIWNERKTATIATSVRLKHLASLYEALKGDEIELLPQFKEPLPPALEDKLRGALPNIDRVNYKELLKGLITNCLAPGVDNPQDPDMSIKEYLSYVDDDILEDAFPEELQMRHAQAVFALVKPAES